MKTKFLAGIITPALLAFPSIAQPAPHHSSAASTNTFTIEWVVDETLKHNPALAAARANVQAAEERVTQARSWDSPRAAFDTKAGRFVSVPENAFTDQRLGVEQPIPLSGKNRLRGNAARSDAAISTEELRRRQLDLVA